MGPIAGLSGKPIGRRKISSRSRLCSRITGITAACIVCPGCAKPESPRKWGSRLGNTALNRSPKTRRLNHGWRYHRCAQLAPEPGVPPPCSNGLLAIRNNGSPMKLPSEGTRDLVINRGRSCFTPYFPEKAAHESVTERLREAKASRTCQSLEMDPWYTDAETDRGERVVSTTHVPVASMPTVDGVISPYLLSMKW